VEVGTTAGESRPCEDIQHARDLLSGATHERPHIIGRIDKHTAPYNSNYDFHLDPASAGFFDYAIEVCDATVPYVNEHIDEVGGPSCPDASGATGAPAWSARFPHRSSQRAIGQRAIGHGDDHRAVGADPAGQPPNAPSRPLACREGAPSCAAESVYSIESSISSPWAGPGRHRALAERGPQQAR
jgi:hypothetical protein